MKVLVTGKGTSGSWQVRGEQLGKAMGATVKPMASRADIKAHDVVLVVKKVPDELLLNLWHCGKPWVYDIVDAYPQPLCSTWSGEQCKAWMRKHIATLKPDHVVFANRKMREDWGLTGGSVVYHHYRPDIKQHVPHQRIKRIGYEGSAKYLDAWIQPILAMCQKRGLSFHVNPSHIAELDVIVAMRGGLWDGYAQRNWKSNVKLANAHGAGVPFVGARESGYEETKCGAEYWADTVVELSRALDWLDDVEVRQEVSRHFHVARYSVEQAARDMLRVLNDIV